MDSSSLEDKSIDRATKHQQEQLLCAVHILSKSTWHMSCSAPCNTCSESSTTQSKENQWFELLMLLLLVVLQ